MKQAMINIFNGQNYCKKNRWGAPAKPVKEITILGAGLMGAGIAQVSIGNGYDVVLKDATVDFLDAGSKNVFNALNKKVKKKKMTKWESECMFEKMKPTLDYRDIAHSDLIIEAVPEILDLKHRVSQNKPTGVVNNHWL